MEWQCRNWLYFTWLSGDDIVEQHVHNLDVINWALKSHPVKCLAMGGRQVRTDPAYGHIYDHFTVEYEYPNGVRMMSMCRQTDGCANNVSERVVGTKGSSNCSGIIDGANKWKFEGEAPSPYVQEHTDLITSIREGKPLNEARQIAHSSLTAIMGRMSAYTGQEITWEQALHSEENLMPEKLEFGPLPVAPVAVPGKTPFI
jgi:predicted dehydrogenase